jgi:hypothetical protein
MKHLTLSQLTKWKPCGDDWIARFKRDYRSKATMTDIEATLIAEKNWSACSWLIGKRLEKLNKRKVCAFAYRCSYRALKYARNHDLKVLNEAIAFAKVFAETGKVDIPAAESAAESARSAAWSAWSAAWSAWSAWSAARSAAWSAAWSAWSARSAAWSAWSAAESAAWSAWSAARSAAWSARSAARSAEYQWQFQQIADIEEHWKGKV